MLIRLYALLFICCLTAYCLPDLAAQCAINVTPSPASCDNTNGSVTVQVTGGVPNYTYAISGPVSDAGSGVDDVFPIFNLPVGNYSITVTDGSGCTATGSATIVEAPAITLTTTQINILCYEEVTGTIDLTVSGGASPYTYNWSTGAFTQDLSDLAAGTHTVTVTDASGCTRTTSATITEPLALELSITTTGPFCSNTNIDAIDLSVSGGTSPYNYLWSNGATTQDLSDVPVALYAVTVTDANGCTKTTAATITEPPPLSFAFSVVNLGCSGGSDGTIDVTVLGGTVPYSYYWSNSAITQDVSGLVAGSYQLTVTDANGCTRNTSIIVTQPTPLTATPIITYTNCASATVQIQTLGGFPPYTYLWTDGNTNSIAVFQNFQSGHYSVTVTDANNCTAIEEVVINISAAGLCGTIAGKVLRDTIENCQNDDEPGLANWTVQAIGANTYYGITDSVGQYYLSVEAGNTYTLFVVPPNALWQPCPSQPLVTVNQPNDTVTAGDILVQKTANCPALTVTIATGQLRRCFEGNSYYIVNYCNQGTTAAENAYVIVQLDPYLSFQLATIPHTDLGNGQLRFDLGNVDIGECKSFNIYVHVSCDAALGQTHCTEAHIYPDSPCVPNNPLWSGASLQVQSLCDADSLRFIIKNVGAGNLTETVNYIVIEDQVMLMSAPVPPLMAGDSVQLAFPANGSTWRVEVGQAAFHPGESQPSVSVEGCTTSGSFSTGFVSQFPNDDADPWLDIDCTANAGSYDPNDKQGFPIGYGTEHYIRPGTDIEYKIRFQNTGTDTAFTVLVVDTLSAWLDPATIKFGPSSHPYRAEIYGAGILKFHFENILLPDSNVNEAASHGFLQFRISPRANAPLETLVENQAAIYFDFNAPVLTNTTFHRLGEQFVTTGLWQPHVPGATIVVSPNPFDQQARLEVKGMTTNNPLELQVFDLQGNKVREINSINASFLLNKGNCPNGVYLFRISEKGKLVGTGKLMVQ